MNEKKLLMLVKSNERFKLDTFFSFLIKIYYGLKV